MDFYAPTVVYTAPLVTLPRFLPKDNMPEGLTSKLERIRSADYYYNGIIVGARSSLMEGFSGQFFQWTFDRPGMDWHGIVTVPTYVDPGLAPPDHHLLFIDCHGPMPQGRVDLASARQEELDPEAHLPHNTSFGPAQPYGAEPTGFSCAKSPRSVSGRGCDLPDRLRDRQCHKECAKMRGGNREQS